MDKKIKIGDIVKINEDVTFYDGQEFDSHVEKELILRLQLSKKKGEVIEANKHSCQVKFKEKDIKNVIYYIAQEITITFAEIKETYPYYLESIRLFHNEIDIVKKSMRFNIK